MGYRKKIVVLDFENKTTYKEEKIGEAVAKKLSDKLDATQRVIILDENIVSEHFKKESVSFQFPFRSVGNETGQPVHGSPGLCLSGQSRM